MAPANDPKENAMNTYTTNLTDITDLSDAELDALLGVEEEDKVISIDFGRKESRAKNAFVKRVWRAIFAEFSEFKLVLTGYDASVDGYKIENVIGGDAELIRARLEEIIKSC